MNYGRNGVVFKKAGTYLPKTNLEILLKVFYFP